MKKTTIFLAICVTVLVATALWFSKSGFLATSEPEQVISETAIQATASPVMAYSFVAKDGEKTAFAVLQAQASIQYKQYDFGVFIDEVNGVKPDSQHFWALYVNEVLAEAGADQMKVKPGDVVKMELEEITQ